MYCIPVSDSLRILLVTLDYPPPPGGIQTIVKNLESGLNKLGHEAEVLHVDTGQFDVRPTDFVPRPRWLYGYRSIICRDFVYLNTVYRRTVEAIEQFDPDLVHAMHVKDWPALVAANERHLPSALSTYALELGNEPLAAQAIRDADVVHALTQFTASLVRSVAHGEPSVEIIPPSIDVSEYQDVLNDTNAASATDPTPVVTMARLVDRKNIETVVKAWTRLDEAVRDGRELVVAGDGPNRRELEILAEGHNDVRFAGWVNGKEKCRLLASADAFAMTPRRDGYDVEGFGIVYIEAQASATPVVGSKHGGAPEAIDDGGVVVDNENNPDEVAEAIEAVLTDETTRRRCLEAASDRIDRFDIKPVARRHVAMYDGIR